MTAVIVCAGRGRGRGIGNRGVLKSIQMQQQMYSTKSHKVLYSS